jgi:hypothetical protein
MPALDGFADAPFIEAPSIDASTVEAPPIEAPRAWAMRAERARRIATMLSTKDAQAIEAYAKECDAMARRAIERQAVRPLTAALAA